MNKIQRIGEYDNRALPVALGPRTCIEAKTVSGRYVKKKPRQFKLRSKKFLGFSGEPISPVNSRSLTSDFYFDWIFQNAPVRLGHLHQRELILQIMADYYFQTANAP